MTRSSLNLDEQEQFAPFKYDDQDFDLSHLDSHTVDYIHKSPGKSDIQYRFYVTYGMHCFAKDYDDLTAADREKLLYHANKESRPFCFRRYHLSKKLRSIIGNLPNEFVFHGGYSAYATCKAQDINGDEVEYYVSFSVFRQKKKLRIHVMSAYPLDESLGKRKKVGFFNIARAVKQNNKLPSP